MTLRTTCEFFHEGIRESAGMFDRFIERGGSVVRRRIFRRTTLAKIAARESAFAARTDRWRSVTKGTIDARASLP